MYNPFRNYVTEDQLPKDRDLSDLPNGMWSFIWFFVRQIKWPVAAMALLQAFSSVLEAMGPYFIKIMVDAFQNVENPNDIWMAFGWALPAFVILFLFVQPISSRIVMAWLAEIRPPFMNMMRRQLSLYLYQHPYEFFQNEFAGRLSSKVLETPHAIIQIVFTIVTSLGFVIFTLLTSLVLFAMVDLVFTIATVVWLACLYLMCWYYVPKIISSSTISHDDLSKVRGRYVDSLNNIAGVFLFGRQKHEDRILRQALRTASESGTHVWHVMNRMYIVLEILSTLFIGIIFYICVVFWQNDQLTLGEVAMVLPLMLRLMQMSWWVSDMLIGLFENLGQVQEGMQAILLKDTWVDQKDKANIVIRNGDIKVQDISFDYGETTVFEQLNLHIQPDQKIGLVGQSGAGKTTLTQLLFRLFDAQDGSILVDDQNIYQFNRQSLREQIAIIPQTTDMFHRTLMDNIRFGRLDATDEEVIEAAKRAHAHDFIMNLPDGYQTMVGERGVKLSGGQRQRIAIARAVLKDAPILILDEATSALDSESERLIQDSLKTLMEGKTVIAIAHRLSTIANLDRLIVMDKGRIVEDGTHAELIDQGGQYAKLWNMQSGGFLGDE